MGEPTVASKRKGVATEGKGAAVEENVVAIRIPKHVKTHKHKADDGYRQVKKETTFASDENESASVEKETTMKAGLATRTTQEQKREQKKHVDRGKQQDNTEPTVVSKRKGGAKE